MPLEDEFSPDPTRTNRIEIPIDIKPVPAGEKFVYRGNPVGGKAAAAFAGERNDDNEYMCVICHVWPRHSGDIKRVTGVYLSLAIRA